MSQGGAGGTRPSGSRGDRFDECDFLRIGTLGRGEARARRDAGARARGRGVPGRTL